MELGCCRRQTFGADACHWLLSARLVLVRLMFSSGKHLSLLMRAGHLPSPVRLIGIYAQVLQHQALHRT